MMMPSSLLRRVSTLVLALAAFGSSGCAADASPESASSAAEELRVVKSDDAIQADLEAAFAGLEYMSESDYPFQVVRAPVAAGERITTAFVKRHFDSMPGSGDDIRTMSLAKMTAEIRTFEDWFSAFAVNPDEPTDDDLVVYYTQMTALKVALAKDLRDLRVYRFGHKMRGGGVDGQVNIFIVGRSPSGAMMGVFTKSVET